MLDKMSTDAIMHGWDTCLSIFPYAFLIIEALQRLSCQKGVQIMMAIT